MAREVGVSKITLFELTSDKIGGTPDYAEPFALPWCVKFETEDEYIEKEIKADNVIESAEKRIDKVNITMEVSSNTPPSLDAKITGKGYKDGKRFTRVGQKASNFAVAYEILMDDGNIRRRIIYNASFTRNSQQNSGDGSSEGETYTYEGVGFPLRSTQDVDMLMDLEEIKALTGGNKEAILEQFNNFFKEPILPDTPLIESQDN